MNWMWWVYVIPHYHLLGNKSLIIVGITKINKQKNDRPHGIARSNVDIVISMLFSLSLELENVILS